jgi:hypothetical protein
MRRKKCASVAFISLLVTLDFMRGYGIIVTRFNMDSKGKWIVHMAWNVLHR